MIFDSLAKSFKHKQRHVDGPLVGRIVSNTGKDMLIVHWTGELRQRQAKTRRWASGRANSAKQSQATTRRWAIGRANSAKVEQRHADGPLVGRIPPKTSKDTPMGHGPMVGRIPAKTSKDTPMGQWSVNSARPKFSVNKQHQATASPSPFRLKHHC